MTVQQCSSRHSSVAWLTSQHIAHILAHTHTCSALHARAPHVFRLLERITYNYNWVQTELYVIPNAMDGATFEPNAEIKWKRDKNQNEHTNGANNVFDAVGIRYIWILCAANRFSISVRWRPSSDTKKVTSNRHEWVRKCRTPATSNTDAHNAIPKRTCPMLKHGRMANK